MKLLVERTPRGSRLMRFAADHPDTTVSLAALNSADVALAVLNAEADLGFFEGPAVPNGLDSQPVAHDRLLVVVRPNSGTRTSPEAALRSYGAMAGPLMELSTASAVRSAVTAGAGPAVLGNLAGRGAIMVVVGSAGICGVGTKLGQLLANAGFASNIWGTAGIPVFTVACPPG